MSFAIRKQKFQDWLTQQWVILTGRKMDASDYEWLTGPFGGMNEIGGGYIKDLAEKENLIIQRNSKNSGLISSVQNLKLTRNNLSEKVIDFYENTSCYDFDFKVKWNPFFRIFGALINYLFSNRIEQLYIPVKNITNPEPIDSELISLCYPDSMEMKYKIWLRTFKSGNRVIFSGIYDLCNLPSGETVVKAIFPLPNGNATVLMNAEVSERGELILISSGRKIGDSGFYFLLRDSNENLHTRFIRSFRSKLTVGEKGNHLVAKHQFSLWHLCVFEFSYRIKKRD